MRRAHFQWTRQLGTSADDDSYGVSADGLGNVYISGYTDGSLGGPNAGSDDAFVSKYDAAGNFQWTRQLGTSATDDSYGVSADGLGNVYFSGYTEAAWADQTPAATTHSWQKSPSCPAISTTTTPSTPPTTSSGARTTAR